MRVRPPSYQRMLRLRARDEPESCMTSPWKYWWKIRLRARRTRWTERWEKTFSGVGVQERKILTVDVQNAIGRKDLAIKILMLRMTPHAFESEWSRVCVEWSTCIVWTHGEKKYFWIAQGCRDQTASDEEKLSQQHLFTWFQGKVQNEWMCILQRIA